MRRLAWAGLTAALLAAAGLRIGLVANRYFDTDELAHMHAGLLVAHGNLPFRDFFGHHGPLFWAMIAPAVAGPADPVAKALAGRALISLFWIGMLLLVALPRRGADPIEGVLAAAWLAFLAVFAQKSLEIRPDVPAAFLVLAACAAAASENRAAAPAAGVLLALAGWCTPKAVFPAMGLMFAAVWRCAQAKGPRVAVRFFGGAVLAAAATLAAGGAYFAARGGLAELWAYYFAYNAGFPGAKVAWSVTLKSSFLADPLAWALGLGGLRRWRARPEESGVLVASLSGLAVTPSAYPQSLLFVAPFLVRFAAAELTDWVRAASARGKGLNGRRRLGACVAGALAVAFAISGTKALLLIREGNALQRGRWRCVSELTPSDARVWDSWSGDSFHRPHAAWLWFVPEDSQSYYDPAKLENRLVSGLADPRTRGAIRCESCLARLPRGVALAFDRYFRASGCGRLWMRKAGL